MADILVNLFENSIVGGAFVYLLWYVTKNFSNAVEKNEKSMLQMSANMENMGKQLSDVSTTLTKINGRMENMESRMERVEREKRREAKGNDG